MVHKRVLCDVSMIGFSQFFSIFAQFTERLCLSKFVPEKHVSDKKKERLDFDSVDLRAQPFFNDVNFQRNQLHSFFVLFVNYIE
jgi:hypothetical protein